MGYFGATGSIGHVNIVKGFVWEGDRREWAHKLFFLHGLSMLELCVLTLYLSPTTFTHSPSLYLFLFTHFRNMYIDSNSFKVICWRWQKRVSTQVVFLAWTAHAWIVCAHPLSVAHHFLSLSLSLSISFFWVNLELIEFLP